MKKHKAGLLLYLFGRLLTLNVNGISQNTGIVQTPQRRRILPLPDCTFIRTKKYHEKYLGIIAAFGVCYMQAQTTFNNKKELLK